MVENREKSSKSITWAKLLYDNENRPNERSREKITKCYRHIYKFFKHPEPLVMIVDSPKAGVIAANILIHDYTKDVEPSEEILLKTEKLVNNGKWREWLKKRKNDRDYTTFLYSGFGSCADMRWTDWISEQENRETPDERYIRFKTEYENIIELNYQGVFASLQFDKVCIVAHMAELHTNDIQLLHNAQGPMATWPDGTGIYYLDGQMFRQEDWEGINENYWIKHPEARYPVKEIFNESNIERRAVMIKYYGFHHLLKELDAKSISTGSRTYFKKPVELFKAKPLAERARPLYILKYNCPVTGREYSPCVPESVGEKCNADYAMAWVRGITDAYPDIPTAVGKYLEMTCEA